METTVRLTYYDADGNPTLLSRYPLGTTGVRLLVAPICPDLLDYDAIGAADGLRGRVVRAFFWLMRAWPA